MADLAPTIRPLALCLMRHQGRILVNEAFDPVKQQRFCRPLGGGIEFGETGAQACARELREEVGAEITGIRFLGTLENIFTYLGRPGHEIVLVYDAEFVDRGLYERPCLEGREGDEVFQASWRALASFGPGLPLYPDGLARLLATAGTQN